MEWLARLRHSLPISSTPFRRKQPSLLFQINSSSNAQQLKQIISTHFDDIVPSAKAFAGTRLRASYHLQQALLRILHQLDNYAHHHRTHVESFTSRIPPVHFQIAVSSPLSLAEGHATVLEDVQSLINVIHVFVGLHIQTLDDIRSSISANDPDYLARAIVTSCRQIASLHTAILQSTNASNLITNIADVNRDCISTSRRQVSDTAHVAGQLGQFLHQNDRKRTSSHDVRLTLQLMYAELDELPSVESHVFWLARLLSGSWSGKKRVRQIGLGFALASTIQYGRMHVGFLGGSGALEEGLTRYSRATNAFVQHSVVEPVSRFYEQVFREAPITADEQTVAISRSSVRGMLIDFTRENLSDVPDAVEDAMNGSMKHVVELIRHQAQRPFRNSVAGNLGQAILLQVQKLKSDVEELMLKSKQLLRAQELNLALVALVPSLLTAIAMLYFGSSLSFWWRSRGTEMIISAEDTARFLLGDIHSSFLAIEHDANLLHDQRNTPQSAERVMRHIKNVGALHMKILELLELIDLRVVTAPPKVRFRFLNDLRTLQCSNTSYRDRRIHVNRMLTCYPFLNKS